MKTRDGAYIFLQEHLHWDYIEVGTLLAVWVVGYGFVQSIAPFITGVRKGGVPDGKNATLWALLLAIFPVAIAAFLYLGWQAEQVLIVGLLCFGVVFAINSAVHSYLIVAYAREEGVSLDVELYYMANALGRLLGTLLSGWIYQFSGLGACLLLSAACIVVASLISIALPRHPLLSG